MSVTPETCPSNVDTLHGSLVSKDNLMSPLIPLMSNEKIRDVSANIKQAKCVIDGLGIHMDEAQKANMTAYVQDVLDQYPGMTKDEMLATISARSSDGKSPMTIGRLISIFEEIQLSPEQ